MNFFYSIKHQQHILILKKRQLKIKMLTFIQKEKSMM